MNLVFTNNLSFFNSLINKIFLNGMSNILLFSFVFFFIMFLLFFTVCYLFDHIHPIADELFHYDQHTDSTIKKIISIMFFIVLLTLVKMIQVNNKANIAHYEYKNKTYVFKLDSIKTNFATIKVTEPVKFMGISFFSLNEKEITCDLNLCQEKIQEIIEHFERYRFLQSKIAFNKTPGFVIDSIPSFLDEASAVVNGYYPLKIDDGQTGFPIFFKAIDQNLTTFKLLEDNKLVDYDLNSNQQNLDSEPARIKIIVKNKNDLSSILNFIKDKYKNKIEISK
jgi:hypothetical protein